MSGGCVIPGDLLEKVRAALAVLPTENSDGWRDIASAPKLSPFIGLEAGKRWVIRWDIRFQQWTSIPGAYAMRPTHWMHLPAAIIAEYRKG